MSDLKENIIDNILESFLKLGYADTSIDLYYPVSSLLILLNCDKENLDKAINDFRHEVVNSLGYINIKELSYEKGRYKIEIPVSGVEWVNKNYKPTSFLESFINEIQKPNQTIDKILDVFYSFSKDIIINELKSDMLAISFKDKKIDKYIYLIEQNEFGLQYHRFSEKEYLRICT